MTDPILLPGTIPGLLRLCSPCWDLLGDVEAIVSGLPDPLSHARRRKYANDQHFALASGGLRHGSLIALTLSDPTGRAHAAWWANRQGPPTTLLWPEAELDLLMAAQGGYDMTPEQIATLRDLVLRLADQPTDDGGA